MRRIALQIGMLVALSLFVGCLSEQKPSANAPANAPAQAGAAPVAPPVEQAPPAPVETEAVKAGVGVGIKGRSLDEHEGILVTPAKSLFAAKERIAFEIAVPHALELYKATEGNVPQSHEEFMEKIIQANQIKLPQLPEGHRYQFDPMTEQLMVIRPKAAQAPTGQPPATPAPASAQP